LLDNKSALFVSSLLKHYYNGVSDIAPKNIESREFGFGDFEKKIAFRHYAFRDERELKEYLVRNAPAFVSCSGAEYRKPAGRPMESKGLLGSELVFDLDSSDIKLACKKEHSDGWICDKCLEAVKEQTIRLIEDFLVPDFGFSAQEMAINFSGNRGYHVHVSSELVYGLGSDARREIANYIACKGIDLSAFFPALGVRGVRLDGPKPTDAGWGGKLADAVIVALNKGTDTLMALGIDKRYASMLYKNRVEIILGITTGNWDKVRIPNKAQFWSNVLGSTAIAQSSSIDRNVTGDLYHLIRLPGTIHGDTGLAAKRIESLSALNDFNPMKEAIAFKGSTVRVTTQKVPGFSMGGAQLGPYDNEKPELPVYAAAYLILKRLATLL
jgi:DNA primase small subunit